jgi:hypothetical protein
MKSKSVLLLIVLMICTSLFSQKLALVRVGKLFGYIDENGVMAINAQYVNAKSFSDDMAAVMVNNKWGFIDRLGKMAIEPTFDNVKYFNDGVAIVAKDKAWRYIDKTGQDITNFPLSDKIYDFCEGRAIFRVGTAVGLFDNQGKIIVEAKYDDIKPLRNGYAKARKHGRWGYLDKHGKEVISFDYDHLGDFNGGPIYGKKGTAFGVIINNTFILVDGVNRIWDFGDNGLAAARLEKSIGFINTSGEWVIRPQYTKARTFINGLAPVQFGKLWGYIDEKGEWVIQPLYIDAEVFSYDGLAPVKVREWGFIDITGKMIIPPNYGITVGGGQMFNFSEKGFVNGFARVKSKKGWAFIDTSGNLLGNRWFTNLELFN